MMSPRYPSAHKRKHCLLVPSFQMLDAKLRSDSGAVIPADPLQYSAPLRRRTASTTFDWTSPDVIQRHYRLGPHLDRTKNRIRERHDDASGSEEMEISFVRYCFLEAIFFSIVLPEDARSAERIDLAMIAILILIDSRLSPTRLST